MTDARIYCVEFKHPHFGWLEYEPEFSSLQAAIDYRNSRGSSVYRYRVVSRLPDGSGLNLEYHESRPRVS